VVHSKRRWLVTDNQTDSDRRRRRFWHATHDCVAPLMTVNNWLHGWFWCHLTQVDLDEGHKASLLLFLASETLCILNPYHIQNQQKYYYYYYYKCQDYSAAITQVREDFTKSRSKTVAQLNEDVSCWPSAWTVPSQPYDRRKRWDSVSLRNVKSEQQVRVSGAATGKARSPRVHNTG